MMKNELPHFNIGSAYGGTQDWCPTHWMKIGGCAAITACDCSLYFELHKHKRGLYPYDLKSISQSDYVDFAYVMEPYLKPRQTGIDRLDIYLEGFSKFLHEHKVTDISLTPWAGSNSLASTQEVITKQIDNGWPIPCLTLLHKHLVLCQDLVQHKMRNFNYFQLTNSDSLATLAL